MVWLIKALFVLARSRRGRKLLLVAARGVFVAARSDRARKLWATARTKVVDPTARP